MCIARSANLTNAPHQTHELCVCVMAMKVMARFHRHQCGRRCAEADGTMVGTGTKQIQILLCCRLSVSRIVCDVHHSCDRSIRVRLSVDSRDLARIIMMECRKKNKKIRKKRKNKEMENISITSYAPPIATMISFISFWFHFAFSRTNGFWILVLLVQPRKSYDG